MEIDTLTIMELNDDISYYEDKEVRVYGNVLVVLHTGDENVFMIDDDYDNIECHVELPDAGYVEKNGMSFTSDEIVNVVSGLKEGEKVMVQGRIGFKDVGEPILIVSYMEVLYRDIMIWCSNK